MRPHEEAKLLSPEELDVQFYAHQWGNMAQSHAAQLALLAHIDAIEAERDRLRDGLMEEARWGAVGRAAALALRPFSKSDAELLDVVLQRALVRARNEGLDLAATSEEHAAMAWEEMGDADEAKRCRARASNIRAMKETEE